MKIFNKTLHVPLFLLTLFLGFAGCAIIYSATEVTNLFTFNMPQKQLFFLIVTTAIALFIFLIDLRLIYQSTYLIYFISLFLLVIVFFIGKSSHGAQRWIPLGFFSLQPSEIAKIAIILALARYMSSNLEDKNKLYFIVSSIMITLLPLALIINQPDLGTSLTLIPIFVIMLFMCGTHIKYFLALFPIGLIPLTIIILGKQGLISTQTFRSLLFFLKPYQQNRVLVFIDPNIDPKGLSYNLIQSKIAIGSGGFTGKGFIQGTQTQLKFIPERHTDFIFCVLGEEWGFIGTSLILVAFGMLLLTSVKIAVSSDDYFAKLASIGIVVLILFQICVNVGMTIGLMPITGLPLPFISYGGSSLLSMMIAMGLLLNFHAHRKQTIRR